MPSTEGVDPGVFSESLQSNLQSSPQWPCPAHTSAVDSDVLRARCNDDDSVGRERQSTSRGRGHGFHPSTHADGRRSDPSEQRDLVPGLYDVRPVRGRLRAVRVLPLGHRHRLQDQPAAHEGRQVARDSANDRALHHSSCGLPAGRPHALRRDRRRGVAERDRRHRRAGGMAERPHPDDPPRHGLHRDRRAGGGHLRPGRLHCQQGRLWWPQVAGAIRYVAETPRRQLLVQHLRAGRPGPAR